MLSVVIPHKDRNEHLAICLHSLERSAVCCGLDSWEAVIVDANSRVLPTISYRGRVILCDDHPDVTLQDKEPPPFWKTHLLNIGVAAAKGDIIACLDADAVVPTRFWDFLMVFPDVTRVAFRVRYAPEGAINWTDAEWDEAFSAKRYSVRCKAHEAYDDPERDKRLESDPQGLPLGNSQFACRAEVLRQVPWDESYIGRGYDDLHHIRAMMRHFGDKFTARIATDRAHALYHLRHIYSPGFAVDRWNAANEARYAAT